MARGWVAASALADIANAVRYHTGSAALISAADLAASVSALDSTAETPRAELAWDGDARGLVDEGVLFSIADAIRSQTGDSFATYTPSEMGAAVRGLSWGAPTLRALLTDRGVFEVCVRATATSAYGEVVGDFAVELGGYSTPGARAWDGVKAQVVAVLIDESVASAGITSCAFWFHGCTNLFEVRGFEHLSGITNMYMMFASCGALESVYASGFDSSAVTSATGVLSGCKRLVGGTGFVAKDTASVDAICLGSTGVLTDALHDERRWLGWRVYGDGVLELFWDKTADAGREVLASGRVCTNACYQAAGAVGWYAWRERFNSVVVDAGCADYYGGVPVNLNYWFYGLPGLASVSGLGNLGGFREMVYAFSGCSTLSELDLRGVSPAGLTNVAYAFMNCSALTTILADSTWALPTSCSGGMCFSGCTSLVGGNGFAYLSYATHYDRFVLDAPGRAGYLTAG